VWTFTCDGIHDATGKCSWWFYRVHLIACLVARTIVRITCCWLNLGASYLFCIKVYVTSPGPLLIGIRNDGRPQRPSSLMSAPSPAEAGWKTCERNLKLAMFCCWSSLCNNNMASNLQSFTQGVTKWGTMPRAPKSPNNVASSSFNAAHFLQKAVGSNMGASNLFLAPCAIQHRDASGFTSSYSRRRFAARDCWSQTSWQVMQRDSDCW